MSLDELSALEAKVKEQNEQLQKSLRMTTVVYAILTVIVLIYTSVVVAKLKEATSPEAVAEMAQSAIITNVPAQRAKLLETISANKDEWADAAMEQMHASLPALEDQVEVLLSQLTGKLVVEIEERLVPAFVEFIKEDAKSLAEQYDATTNEEIAAAYAELFIQVIDQEMDKFLNRNFINACEKLQMRLQELSKPGAKLTKKQDAQRRLIQAWAHLTDHQEFGQAIFTDLLAAFKNKFEEMTQEEIPELEKVEGLDAPLRLIPEE